MLEIIVSVLLVILLIATIVALITWASNYEPCRSHRFERVDDGTEKYAIYICKDCGKLKRMKLR